MQYFYKGTIKWIFHTNDGEQVEFAHTQSERIDYFQDGHVSLVIKSAAIDDFIAENMEKITKIERIISAYDMQAKEKTELTEVFDGVKMTRAVQSGIASGVITLIIYAERA